MKISKDLNENISYLDEVFRDCGDIVKRKMRVGDRNEVYVYIIYIDMMTNRDVIDEKIVRQMVIDERLFTNENGTLAHNVLEVIKDHGITTVDLSEVTEFSEITTNIMCGDTVLFVEGYDKAMNISTKGFPNRGVSTADTEVVVQGSKEAFSEVFRFNTALIRRRIRDTNLKIKQYRVGQRSKTDVALVYMDDLVRKDILNEVIGRIQNIDIDAIQDIGYIEQLIEDDWMSPFPQGQVTERPDKASASILEGRIVIIVDNSPFVLIVPTTLNSFFQASEDYFQRWEIASFVRVIRYIAAIFAVCLPGLYIALAVYHPTMIPIALVFKMVSARQNVPFPAVIEILIMDLAFELLREAGIRLPGPVGSTIGIVGGLIIGQAAVEAGLVSPIVVIIVALTGISSFSIPSYSLASGFRLMKYVIVIASAVLGLFGFWIGVLFLLIHLVSLKSFGIPYLFPFTSGDVNHFSDLKDTIFRMPLFQMKHRPIFANPTDRVRMKKDATGNKKKRE